MFVSRRAVLLLGLLVLRSGEGAGAQTRLPTIAPSTTLAPPPPPYVAGASPTSVSPGSVVTLTGTGLSGVTAVALQPGHKDVYLNYAIVPDPAWSPSTVAAQHVPNANRTMLLNGKMSTFETVTFTVPVPPSNGQWYQGHPLFVIVSTPGGTDTLATPLIIDRQPAITGVDKALVMAGQRLTVFGRNLDKVVAGFMGSGSKSTVQNPRFTALPLAWDGTSAYIDTPGDCNEDGTLVLEASFAPGPFPYGAPSNGPIYVTGPTVGCGITPLVTAIQPALSPNGGTVWLTGKGFGHVTDVLINGTTTPLTWSRYPSPTSDNQLKVTLPTYAPAAYGLNATSQVGVMLKAAAPILPGFVTPDPRIAFPPKISSIWPGWGQTNLTIALQGSALYGAPWLIPVVKVSGVTALLDPQAQQSSTTLHFVMPSVSGPGPITIETAGGVDTVRTPFIFVNGPSSITQIDPASGKPGDRITVRGTNVARVGGLCVGPASSTAPIQWEWEGGAYSATSNTEFTVLVPSYAQSGPVSFWLNGNTGTASCLAPGALQFQRLP